MRDESKLALDSMVMLLKDHPNIVIEMAAHTDRIGSDKYNNGLSQRRAQSVVDYLVENGIPRERLKPAGYGKTRPKTVTKRIHSQYPQFEEGVTLTEEFIKKLSKEDREAADQINRRTEFQVIDTTYEY